MPVYRDENNVLRAHSSVDRYQGQRAYIKDSLRDKEIDIAQGVILKNCKEPYNEAKQQQAHTKWLNKQYCDAAKIELQHYQQPKLRASKQTLRGKKLLLNTIAHNNELLSSIRVLKLSLIIRFRILM